jgi:hypothetical protein
MRLLLAPLRVLKHEALSMAGPVQARLAGTLAISFTGAGRSCSLEGFFIASSRSALSENDARAQDQQNRHSKQPRGLAVSACALHINLSQADGLAGFHSSV